MANTAKNKSNKGLWLGIGIGVVAVALVVSPQLLSKGKQDAYQSVAVTKETIQTYYTFTGSVGSKDSETVMSQKITQIKEIKVLEGALVKKDDVLMIAQDGTKIKASVSGTVTHLAVEVNQQVMAGGKLCEIVNFDNLEVIVKVDEYDLSAIHQGDKIDVTIHAIDKDIVGTVSKVSDTAINQNGIAFFTATVDLAKDKDIKVGMTAEASILNEESIDTLTIPMKALMFDNNNTPYVYSKNSDGSITKLAVIAGISDGKTVEILSGVTNGNTIYYTETVAKSSDDGGFKGPLQRP